jgi:methionyl-tRNA formyltransferase
MKTSVGPVKELAQRAGIKVFQPQHVNDEPSVELLKKYGADLFVVIAYGQFLSGAILALPKKMAINVHSSLLPKYRGAAPINWVIINGETTTGISIIKMGRKMDAGDVIGRLALPIKPDDTALTLRECMKKAGPRFLLETIGKIEKGTCSPEAQDERQASVAPKLSKELGKIDWNVAAVKINNLIRGLQPWPGAYTSCQGKLLKILEAEVIEAASGVGMGLITQVAKSYFCVATGRGALKITRVHPESSRPMSAAEFLIGHKIVPGDKLG